MSWRATRADVENTLGLEHDLQMCSDCLIISHSAVEVSLDQDDRPPGHQGAGGGEYLGHNLAYVWGT